MKKAVIMLLIAVSIILISTSGAYTSLSADRTAEISVVSDGNALLALAPCTGTGTNGQYFVDTDSDGAYELRITNESTGLNINSNIDINNIFTITNNNTRSMTVTLTDNGTYPNLTDFGAIERGIVLDVGQSTTVSLSINTNGLEDGISLIDSLTLNAQ